MPIDFQDEHAALTGPCDAEDADALAAFLLERPGSAVTLDGCTHAHLAVVQVLRSAGPGRRRGSLPGVLGLALEDRGGPVRGER